MTNSYRYDSITVGRFLWAKAQEQSVDIAITKHQKLLYILYGTFLAFTAQRLTDEHPHAWPYGPVFPNVRKDFIQNEDYKNVQIKDPSFAPLLRDPQLTECTRATLKYFGLWNATELVDFTHQEDSPWTHTTQKNFFEWNDIITDEDILPFFKKIWIWNK